MSRLITKVGSLKLPNPTVLASGILGHGSLMRRAIVEGGAGGVVTRSLTREPREGYATPVIVGTRAGLVNAVGLANPGFRSFLENELPIAKGTGACVIVSVAGTSAGEFAEISAAAEGAGADAVELNLSCPHVEKRGLELGADPELVRDIVEEVKGILKIPVHVKLGVADRLGEVALAAEGAGADAAVAINTVRAMAIDVHARVPAISNVYGGLSGPAIHPIAVRCVYELYELLSIPIIGSGGVEDWMTAVEFLLAGARAVQIGSAVAVKGLSVFKEVAEGIERYLDSYGFKGVEEVVGLAHKR